MAKRILLICLSAILAKSALSQCLAGPINRPYDLGIGGPLPIGYGGYAGYGGCGIPGDIGFANPLGMANGGGLFVTSTSPIAPTGLFVTSENVIEGVLTLGGNLPFLGAVTMEGVFPSAGAGSVSYACGDGYFGIVGELPYATTYGPVAPAYAPTPYGPAVAASYGPAVPAPYGPAVPASYVSAVQAPYGPAGPYAYGPGVIDYGVAPYGGCGYGPLY